MSQFGFLLPEWPDLHGAAQRAEALALSDGRAAAFYARRALEIAVAWLYRFDRRLRPPVTDNLAALIGEPGFRATTGDAIFFKARFLKDLGNKAVHGERPFSDGEARTAVSELFHLCFWLARTYGKNTRPPDALAFEPAKLPRPLAQVARLTLDQLRKREAELRAKDEELEALRAERAALDEELRRAREAVEEARKANAVTPDRHDYDEAATRDHYIDLLLREAGWDPAAPGVAEVPVSGMPFGTGQGFVDYVLWGDDGRPLALVEAKRTRHDPLKGQEQARLYADALERAHGQRPVIFCSNGYEHVLWDDGRYPPRPIQGFYGKAELALLIQRRTTRRSLADAAPDGRVVERHYQHRAIRRVAEAFEGRNRRKALLVMATGAGKTRTVIALAELLMRQNWAKRVLFLADRVALVNQAVAAFKAYLPSAAPVSLLTDKAAEGRVYVATYPTMMSLIEERDGSGRRRFGVGHFDLVIVDEAHRSIYRKYGAIFDWFDSLLVGLTATPKDEIDRNTYGLFGLENGMPTDAYGLEEAVRDGFLVPMRAVSVPLKFQREGIRYDDLSEEDKEEWDALEWSEEDGPPDRVEAQAVNKWLFNTDTVDKVLAHLMTRGQHVEGGDRLGKTIIFAKNHAHAEFIRERFDANYPHLNGSFARVIDFQVDYAQSLIDCFSVPSKPPHIAISVDMLDTGIDVPEVVNLVFFKLVRSRTKFWQMIGRGTRLCPDLFGPGQDKAFFYVFDFCQNLEFFSQEAGTAEGSVGDSLSARLFKVRVDLIGALDERLRDSGYEADAGLRGQVASLLRHEVAAMNVDNFLVRPRRRLVETFADPAAWTVLDEDARLRLATELAGLPSERSPEALEAKQFDLLLLNLQLCVLGAGTNFTKLKGRVVEIAAALEEQATIPVIAAQISLIQEVQTDGWWQDVTVGLQEGARKRLRGLVHLIEKRSRKPIYTDFEDEIGEETGVDFQALASPDAFEKFRAKARQFLRQHEDHVAVHKLHTNRQLTATDLDELERMLRECGAGSAEDVDRAKAEAQGLGLFVRSLVGLDRAAAKDAFAGFLTGRALTGNQIEFVNMVVDHLTEHGLVEPGRLYESPYTDLSPMGVDGLFAEDTADALVSILEEVKRRAAA